MATVCNYVQIKPVWTCENTNSAKNFLDSDVNDFVLIGNRFGSFPTSISVLWTESLVEISIVVETTNDSSRNWMGFYASLQYPKDLENIFNKRDLINFKKFHQTIHKILLSGKQGTEHSPLIIVNDSNNAYWEISEKNKKRIGYFPLKKTSNFHNLNAYPVIHIQNPIAKPPFVMFTNLDRNKLFVQFPVFDRLFSNYLHHVSSQLLKKDSLILSVTKSNEDIRNAIRDTLNQASDSVSNIHVTSLSLVTSKDKATADHVVLREVDGRTHLSLCGTSYFINESKIKILEKAEKKELNRYFSSLSHDLNNLHRIISKESEVSIFNNFMQNSDTKSPAIYSLSEQYKEFTNIGEDFEFKSKSALDNGTSLETNTDIAPKFNSPLSSDSKPKPFFFYPHENGVEYEWLTPIRWLENDKSAQRNPSSPYKPTPPSQNQKKNILPQTNTSKSNEKQARRKLKLNDTPQKLFTSDQNPPSKSETNKNSNKPESTNTKLEPIHIKKPEVNVNPQTILTKPEAHNNTNKVKSPPIQAKPTEPLENIDVRKLASILGKAMANYQKVES